MAGSGECRRKPGTAGQPDECIVALATGGHTRHLLLCRWGYSGPIVLQMRIPLEGPPDVARCSCLVSLLQGSPQSGSQVSGPRSVQQRPTSPTPAVLHARHWSSWADMSSTIGAEETFCVATQPLADVNGSASYLGWGWLSISVPNLIVILVMILLFVLAIVLPFPKDRQNR
jgi:hypothetical protein